MPVYFLDPDFLPKESLRTPSMSLNLPPSHTSSTSSHGCKRTCCRRTSCSSQTSSVGSCTCGNEVREVCSGSEGEDGESKLSQGTYVTCICIGPYILTEFVRGLQIKGNKSATEEKW